MATFTLPHFGPIDPSELEEYYNATIPFSNTTIEADLNFESKIITVEKLETVKHFIENIRIYDINNKGYMANEYNDEDGDTVQFYLQHHLEELGTTELAALLPPGSKSTDHEKLLLQKLHLVRVGIYPHNTDYFAVFDYTLGQDITDQLVVIITDENGNLDYMTVES
jgi:Protein of unknown function (DUF2004)